MAVLTPRSVFRRYNVDGVPSSGHHKVIKDEVVQLLEQVFGVSRGGWVVTQTLAELNGVTPENETDGGVVLADPDPAKNGYYDRNEAAWVKGRGFPDTFARVELSGGGSAQTGAVKAGVNPADIEVFFAFVEIANDGPLTLAIGGEAPREVVNLAGQALSVGEWTGAVMFALRDGKYQLLLDAGAATAAAQSASDAKDEADRAGEARDEAGDAAERAETAAAGVEFPVSYGAAQVLTATQRKQARHNIRDPFPTVANLIADTDLGYAEDEPNVVVAEGDIITAQGFRYEVVAGDAAEFDEETAGGVRLVLAQYDEELREQARSVVRAVGYDEQILSETEKATARLNIGLNALASPGIDTSPLYLDQFVGSFYGRGMKTAETINVLTDQALAGDSAAGSGSVTLTDATNILAGSTVTIKHDNGKYWTYWVFGKSGNVLIVRPGLKWAATVAGGAMAERTWQNRAHAGNFYMRHLADRLVDTPDMEMQIPTRGRLFFTQFTDNGSVADDQMTPVNSGVVSYFSASSTNTGGADDPPRFNTRATAFITMNSAGAGAQSATKTVVPGQVYIARVMTLLNNTTLIPLLQIVAPGSPTRPIAQAVIPNGAPNTTFQRYTTIAFRVPNNVTSIAVRFVNNGGSGAVAVNQIEIFPADAIQGNIFQRKPDAKIVVTGDSWAAGALPDRESFVARLEERLPDATIVNTGVGGTKITDKLSNFQSEVAAYSPEVVVLHTGVNECYNPLSVTFNPTHLVEFTNAMGEFVSRCMAIGAKPIIIGTPALAEADTNGGYTDWTLNDRAMLQSAWMYQNL